MRAKRRGEGAAERAERAAPDRIALYRDGELVIDATDPDGTIVAVRFEVIGGTGGAADGFGCGSRSAKSAWSVPLDLPPGEHRIRVTAESVACDEQPQVPMQKATRSAAVRVP